MRGAKAVFQPGAVKGFQPGSDNGARGDAGFQPGRISAKGDKTFFLFKFYFNTYVS